MAGYRIEPAGPVDAGAIIDFWRGEGLDLREREGRRVHEVVFVALDGHGELAGECSVYLQRADHLGLDLWYLRVFAGREHRMSGVATDLVRATHRELEARFARGDDTRGKGIAMEIENTGLGTRAHAVWPNTGATFAGLSRDHHLRLLWFEGARAPEALV